MFPLKDNLRCNNFATISTWLIVANLLAFFAEVGMIVSGHQEEFFSTWLMVPHNFFTDIASGDPTAVGWAIVTVFSSMFLHGSLGHIFGNMFFLYVFGKAVENRIGKWRFLAFYLLCGVLASLCHAYSEPGSMIPTLGASGAIAGVLGAYLLLWPTATITGFYVAPAPALVQTKAYWFLFGWFIMQITGVLQAIGSVSGGGVALWAHIGGFIAGFILAGLVKIFQPVTEVCIIPVPDCKTNDDDAKAEKKKKK